MRNRRKAAAVLAIAATLGALTAVPASAANNCRRAEVREVGDRIIQLIECSSPRADWERVAHAELIGGHGGENISLWYFRWDSGKGSVPGSFRTVAGYVTSTPEYYSLPYELQACAGIGAELYCTWPP
jgi:hypothetical protein